MMFCIGRPPNSSGAFGAYAGSKADDCSHPCGRRAEEAPKTCAVNDWSRPRVITDRLAAAPAWYASDREGFPLRRMGHMWLTWCEATLFFCQAARVDQGATTLDVTGGRVMSKGDAQERGGSAGQTCSLPSQRSGVRIAF